jgi:hypothetical protein
MKNAAADVLYQLMLTRNPIVDGSIPKHSKNQANPDFLGESAVRSANAKPSLLASLRRQGHGADTA